MTKGAEKLKAWRKASKLSQETAAGRVGRKGVSQAAWCSWESGEKRPNIDQLVALVALTSASEHAVSVHDFVEEEEAREERIAKKRPRPAA